MATALELPDTGPPDGVSHYVRLASLLRHRIASGEWAVGQQLPTVKALAERLDIARVTVRHAYAVLAREGLISSRRGRGTFVEAAPGGVDARLRAAIDDPRAGDIRFDVLSRDMDAALPGELGGSVETGRYVRIRKIHLHDGEPFCLADIYVAADVYRRFPRHGEERSKLANLLMDHGGVALSTMQQRMTVVPADETVAHHLDYRFAAPVAHMRRRVLAQDGRPVYAGLFWYRGDRFVTETETPVDVWMRYPGVPVPRAET